MTTFNYLLINAFCCFFIVAVLGCSSATESQEEEKASSPNIIVIMADDMGYSDIGYYGSEIATPNLDALAEVGLRFRQFYNAARCCPTRASLLTGLYPHEAGMGGMVSSLNSQPEPGPYQGFLSDSSVTIAEGFYMTDAFSDYAVSFLDEHFEQKQDQPFLLYLSYTAPHWPLHALPEDIQKYEGKYDINKKLY